MGKVFPTHAQFKSTSPFLDFSFIAFFKEVRVQMFTLHRECCRGLWLTLAMALFMIWPSITLRNPNSLLQPYTFCLKPALKCCTATCWTHRCCSFRCFQTEQTCPINLRCQNVHMWIESYIYLFGEVQIGY